MENSEVTPCNNVDCPMTQESCERFSTKLLMQVFDMVDRLAQGDPNVRLEIDSDDELIQSLAEKLNQLAVSIQSMVEESHELAIGLCEHYDALNRIANGDHSTRAPINSPNELISKLGELINRSEASLIRTIYERAQSDERHSAFIAMSNDGIWCGELNPPLETETPLDYQVAYMIENIKIAECNNALAGIYGYAGATDMVGRRMREFYDLENVQGVLERFIASGYSLKEYETRQFDRNGHEIWVSSSLKAVITDGKISRLWGVRRDVTEKKRQIAVLEHQATHDSLTNLPNRFSLLKQLETRLEKLQDQGQVAMFMLDLDRFKEVNDTLSHQAGDLLLIEIGRRLHHVLAGVGGDIFRLGGDEFAVIYSRIRNERDLFWLAELILRTMQSPFDIQNIKVEIQASIGIAVAPTHGVTSASLLRCSDIAMYRAKKEMKRYCIYNPEIDHYTSERLMLMNDLSRTIRANQLSIHFQPKIEFTAGGLAGFEALVRWYHPERGLLMPAEFIPFAEIGELIVPLTYQIIEKSIRQLREWQDAGFNTSIACNLSTRLLMDEDLYYHIEAFLKNYGVAPESLELEITETALIIDPDRAKEILNRISSLGVRLSIDDFGTGYSSLALLKSLPLNALKIDLLFVSQMLQSEQDAIIVSSTINLAHNLGLKVIAEGVETVETLERLRAIGCDQAQGYFIGFPMCAEEAGVWADREGERFRWPANP